ncbi:hypothetical protein BX600DRAFT_163709 [Xylariales sp. PMI_506]|nr:hypothetical protein BX600DRAFT_163709 [Xylariales sp. PMI_506]
MGFFFFFFFFLLTGVARKRSLPEVHRKSDRRYCQRAKKLRAPTEENRLDENVENYEARLNKVSHIKKIYKY